MAIYLGSEQVGGGVDSLSILDLVYPVGSIYYSNNNTNPSTLFGGTWTEEDAPYIIEEGGTGTHNNWYYRKWSDGTLECWIKREFSSVIDNSWGQLWYKSIGVLPDYPVSFRYLPSVTGSAHASSGNSWPTFSTNNVSVTNCGTIYIISPAKQTTSILLNINVHAIGKWTDNSGIVSKRWTRTA